MNDSDIKIAADRLVAEANMRVARAIRALEQAQHDADRANEAVNRAREEAKSAQHVAEESLAALKAMLCDEQATAATDTPRAETARIVIEADTSEATTALKDTAGALDAVTAAANAASTALDNLNSELPIMFSVDLVDESGRSRVTFSGPCELFARGERLGIAGIVDMAKRAQRALNQPIVDQPKA